MNWVEHLELLEDAVREMDRIILQPDIESPASFIDAFCFVEGVVGEWWENFP